MKLPTLFVLALAMAAPVATAAYADRPTQVGVRYNDLDLSRRSDAAAMLGRLDQAALQACGASPFASLREYQMAIRESHCYAASLGRAVAGLNAPTVTELYDRQAQRVAVD